MLRAFFGYLLTADVPPVKILCMGLTCTYNSIVLHSQTKQSVLDFLVRASDKDLIEDEGPTVHLMEEKIISHCLNFLMAAYDTSSFSLTMCSFLLATHSKVQEKLCSHLDQYWKENPVSICTETLNCTSTIILVFMHCYMHSAK